jgi:cellulose synthase (UDP-forming)
MGYPIVTGCHNTHRASALKQVGGFAAHEADDLLITVHYRRWGWKGVYVPKILAKGLTPVDWASYLGQQRRWARSVVDIKFRVYPKVVAQLPPLERVIGFVHGLYYLQSLATALQVLLLAVMLVTGITPHVLSLATVPSVLILLAVWHLCDVYRQRFYLEPRHERGLHWRAGVLRCAKWPYLLLALYDNLRPRRRPYIITPKVKAASKSHPLSLPHLVVVGVISLAWLTGTLLGWVTNPIVPVAGAMMVLCSLGVIATGYLRFPAPYDPSLSEARTHKAMD